MSAKNKAIELESVHGHKVAVEIAYNTIGCIGDGFAQAYLRNYWRTVLSILIAD